jgi:glycosyltransferase involved in cell wall biosynthesis
MRVLVVHNWYRSGQPSGENAVVEDESRLLEEAGCVVERLEMRSDEIAGWPLRRRAAVPARVVWSQPAYRETAATIARFRPDVVHFHNTFPLISPSALWAAHRSGTPVVHTLHNFRALCPAGSFFRDGRICEACLGRAPLPAVIHRCYRGSAAATLPIAAKDWFHSAIRTWLHCVDLFIAPSEFTRSKYIEAGWPGAKIAVKHNTAPEPQSFEDPWTGAFVCLSRFETAKGTDVLLEAWRQAFPQGDQTLRLVGSGDKVFSEARIPGVELYGQLERAKALDVLAGARVLVVPSRGYEVFPRVVVEAYALGVPIIATRVGSLPELVDDGRTGLLVAPGSVSELAGALARLAASDELARELGRGARCAYERNYSPKMLTSRLLEIYDHVAPTAARAA